MLELLPACPTSRPLRVLCLGAHCDDIEIGCGGTLIRLSSLPGQLHIQFIIFSGEGQREQEARDSARVLLEDAASWDIEVLGFRDGFFPEQWGEIKEFFETLKRDPAPDLIFTHRRLDRHQDHRTVADLTWNTFRDHLILEYEVPKYEGDLGQPNLYVPLEDSVARQKADHVTHSFPTQQRRSWFDPRTFLGLTRLRGLECRADHGHAEAFHLEKAVFALSEES